MLKEERPYLLKQIKGLEDLNKSYILQDSIRVVELQARETQIKIYQKENVKLSKKLKFYKFFPYISGGLAATLIGVLICR